MGIWWALGHRPRGGLGAAGRRRWSGRSRT